MNDIAASVQRIAELIMLDGDTFTMLSKSITGGMARRLSLGIALVGQPNILILDEPSAGLDPSSREIVWNVVASSVAAKRSIIITTHHMDEADTLCNRVGIMAGGTLRAIGTQLHLKNKYGYGYRLTVVYHNDTFNDGFIFELCPEAVVIDQIGNTVDYDLPKDAIDVSVVFKTMDDIKTNKSLAVKDWALSHTSLEEVFVNVSDEIGPDIINPKISDSSIASGRIRSRSIESPSTLTVDL